MRERFVLAALIACVTMSITMPALAEPNAQSPYRKLEIFARALAHIEHSHVEDVDEDALVYGAIRGMLQVLDPHSAFMDPDEFRILTSDTEGRYGGIGVEIDVRDGWLTVLKVFDGGPAARADLRPGDRFLTIDGQGARDLPIAEAIERMRGEPGTRVQVTLRRPEVEAAVEATLTREIIEIDAVEARLLRDRVLYVRLRAFQETTGKELRQALDHAVEQTAGKGGVAGLMLDLRDNPGGLLSAAVLVADEFLDEGVIVSTRGRSERLLREFRASSGGTRPDWPMVVIVNGYSASASEIVAGALRDHRRAVLVGTRTFGKGSVQNVIELPDQSAMKLTTALYYTPRGVSIQAEGIAPDVRVEREIPSGVLAGRAGEASLEGHLGADDDAPRPADRGTRGADRAAGRSAPAPFADDNQARMAHEVLRALITSR